MKFRKVSLLHIFVVGLKFQLSDSFAIRQGSVGTVSANYRQSLELYGITKSQTAVLDGSSFNALDLFLAAEGKLTGSKPSRSNTKNRHGYCSVITVKLSNNKRVIGIKVDHAATTNSESLETVSIENGVEIYKDSMATIPDSISDDDAISTCVASLAAIHCAIHDPIRPDDKIVQNVGGSTETFVSAIETVTLQNKKAVVVGGSDYASFVAE